MILSFSLTLSCMPLSLIADFLKKFFPLRGLVRYFYKSILEFLLQILKHAAAFAFVHICPLFLLSSALTFPSMIV